VDGYICTLFDIDTEMGDKLNGETFHTVWFNKPDRNYSFCAMAEVKPYLRPMESMTDDEREDWYRQSKVDYDCEFKPEPTLSPEHCYLSVDWLNKYGFDYRGLIPMGLALEAPKGMYKIE